MVLQNEVHVGAVVHPVGRVEAQLAHRVRSIPSLCQAVADVQQQGGGCVTTCRRQLTIVPRDSCLPLIISFGLKIWILDSDLSS